MLSKTSLVAVLAVVIAAAFTGVGVASTDHTSGHARQLKVFAVVTASTQVDVDDDGALSVGDATILQSANYDEPGGAKIGTGTVTCIVVDAATGDSDCQGSDVLPGGEIREAGRFLASDPANFHWAIVGGTGKYRGASGQLDGAVIDAQGTVALTFTLLRP